MRVFVLPSWFPPNGGSFFLEQSIVLNEIADEIVLYVEPISIKMLIKNPFKIKKLFVIQEESIDGLKIIRGYNLRVPKFFLPNLYIEKFAYIKLYKYALKKYGKPDLIHAHSAIWGGWYAYHIKNIYKISYIITEHRGRFVDNKYAKLFNQLPKKFDSFLKKIFINADYIIPVSYVMIKKIKTYANNKNIMSIPNMLNEELFFYDKNVKKNKQFTFITVAGLTSLKSIDILINSFKTLIDKELDCKLLIIGDGEERKNLEELVSNLGLRDFIKFLGQQNRKDVASNIKKSHIFVLPTKYEAFGVVFIEALSCGLPIISTKKSGGPDFIITNENGILVEIDNLEELSQALQEIYQNYSKYNQLEIAQEAKKKYGKESFKKIYQKVYREVVNEN